MFRAEPYPTCSRTLPSPSPWGRGSGRVRLHVGYLGIPAIFQLVCHAFLSITFAFSGYSRSVEARNCRSDRRETGTQIGLIGKTENRIGYQTRKPVSNFHSKYAPKNHPSNKYHLCHDRTCCLPTIGQFLFHNE